MYSIDLQGAHAQDDDPDATDAGASDASTSPPLAEVFDEAIRNLARSKNREALRAFERKDYPAALALFRQAYDLDRLDPEITNNLAYLYEVLGNRGEAERFYRETLAMDAKRSIAHLNLADLMALEGADDARLAEAADLLARARELRGNQAGIIRRQAELAARRGRFAEAERFFQELLERAPADDALALTLGDFYRAFGKDDEALSWYRRVEDPDGLLKEAARRIRTIEVERAARRFGWTRPTDAVPPQAQALADRAAAMIRQGQLAEAEPLLLQALEQAPGFAAAHADLGDLYRRQGRPVEAEQALLRALAYEGANAEHVLRLARLYAGLQRSGEAAWFYARALQLRPDWTDVRVDLAKAYRAAGDLPRALHQVERYLAEQPPEAATAEARTLARTLRDLLPAQPAPPDARAEGDDVLPKALARARALLAQGEPDGAMAELRGLPDDLRGVAVLNLEGRILQAAGRLDEAAETFGRSLIRDPEQAPVIEQLGRLELDRGHGDEARRLLIRAEALGVATAGVRLARLDATLVPGAGPAWWRDALNLRGLLHARDRLRSYLADPAADRLRGEAEALLIDVEARVQTTAAIGGAVVFGLLLLGGWSARRCWGGTDLAGLVRRHPEAGPEVQQILSAIRHEVLKHNTMVLTGLVDALESDADDAADKAGWARASLLGDPLGDPRDAAATRLEDYADRLRRIGRAHGVRLNLRRKDPALSALLRGFRVLRGASGLMDRAARLGRTGRGRLLRALRQATRLLNVEGYEAVRALLDRLRVLDVDADLLRSVFERTRREPAFADADVAPLALEDAAPLPCRLVIPRHAFEDVLANLIRNGLQSSLRHGGDGPVRIGLRVEAEVDPITGLARAVLLIRDASPQRLTPEMLRGRYIEEGLGLTADLVSRYEGTVDVREAAAPWTKAVVLKLPRADEEDEEAA